MKKKKKSPIRIDVITLFPGMFEGPLTESLMGRAQEAGLAQIYIHNLRKWSVDRRHQKVDDRPFGGGAGMLISAEPVYQAFKELGGLKKSRTKPTIIFVSPQGKPFNQQSALRLSQKGHFIILCGHYEGVDQRVLEYVDEEISLGDYVLTGGEIPALAIIDSVVRLVPGVVGDPQSIVEESFTGGMLEYPHYTRPQIWRRKSVPDVLLSGHHKNIEKWRAENALKQTRLKRPDLLSSQPRKRKKI